ncbi:MAG: type II toxin-antitoxin system Phd/YefM family antitoxin [bacterium]|nr:type II toxin-antitoxin system Phd/YefM family antitoxin [bacterium]
MRTTNILPVSEARKKIFQIIKDVQHPDLFFTLTLMGKPKAVILSADEFESWQETVETLKDIPDLKKDIEETEKAIKSGEYKSWISLEEILAKEGFLVTDNVFDKKKHGIQSKNPAKSKKRAK